MIPKVIHYCWFGKKEKPDVIKKCIESWKKYCPDWKIIEWNEDNLDISSNLYMKEAYEKEKWAFVSDVARLKIIYQFGGVYMDTDVELLEPIDAWIKENAFFSFESTRNIATGMGFGAVKGHKSIKAMLDYYNNRHFIIKERIDMTPCPAGNTESFVQEYGEFKRNGFTQLIEDVLIISYEEYSKKAVHHGTGTWVENYEKRKNPYKNTKLKSFLRRYESFEFVEKFFGKKMVSIYCFIVYDLYEMGVIYYIKRLVLKVRRKDK